MDTSCLSFWQLLPQVSLSIIKETYILCSSFYVFVWGWVLKVTVFFTYYFCWKTCLFISLSLSLSLSLSCVCLPNSDFSWKKLLYNVPFGIKQNWSYHFSTGVLHSLVTIWMNTNVIVYSTLHIISLLQCCHVLHLKNC